MEKTAGPLASDQGSNEKSATGFIGEMVVKRSAGIRPIGLGAGMCHRVPFRTCQSGKETHEPFAIGLSHFRANRGKKKATKAGKRMMFGKEVKVKAGKLKLRFGSKRWGRFRSARRKESRDPRVS